MRFILILFVFLVASPSCISQDKKEDYWKKKLTKEQYHILRERGLREHSLENIGIIRRKENISVQVVVKAFSLLIQNMIQVLDGHVSLMLKISNM